MINFSGLLLALLSMALSTRSEVCDASACLFEECLTNVTNNPTNETNFPCSDDWQGRPTSNENEYICCPPGYEKLSIDVLQECSTDACSSPDGAGGEDCSADGFIHPMVCSSDSPYVYPRKEPGATIYSPYVCCTSRADNVDQGLLVTASIWTVLSFLSFLASMILIVGILHSKKVRAQGFNLYLVYLAIPDALFNIFSFGRNICNISGRHLSSPFGGTVHALEWFHTAANMWLNALIVYQVYDMLIKAKRFVRTKPPTTRHVAIHAFCVYCFSAMWAAWSLALLLQGSNMFTNTNAAWLTSKSVMVGPPFLYVTVVCLVVWWKRLLPLQGRTRVLSVYFLRVVVVFLLTWVPFLLLVDITYYKTQSLWMLGLAYYFSALQGLLSAIAALGKPDIKRAILNLLYCRGDDFDPNEARFLDGSTRNSLGRSIFGRTTSFAPSNFSQRLASFTSARRASSTADQNEANTTSKHTSQTMNCNLSTAIKKVSEWEQEDDYGAEPTKGEIVPGEDDCEGKEWDQGGDYGIESLIKGEMVGEQQEDKECKATGKPSTV